MTELREIIAKNICDLRTSLGLTQQKLAERLNYSDKAVSKWERGESIPDVTVLKQIADYFGVTVDFLLSEEHGRFQPVPHHSARNHFLIAALSVTIAWLIATIVFAELNIFVTTIRFAPWLVFIYAMTASFVVILVFNSIWGRIRANFIVVSGILWSLITSMHLTVLTVSQLNLWLLYIVGIPVQVIIILWSCIVTAKRREKKIKKNASSKERAVNTDE